MNKGFYYIPSGTIVSYLDSLYLTLMAFRLVSVALDIILCISLRHARRSDSSNPVLSDSEGNLEKKTEIEFILFLNMKSLLYSTKQHGKLN